MSAVGLDLSSLHQMFPELAEDFSSQLNAAVKDCRERSHVEKPRVVLLKLKITPNKKDGADVDISPVLSQTVPVSEFEPVTGRTGVKNQILFDFAD